VPVFFSFLLLFNLAGLTVPKTTVACCCILAHVCVEFFFSNMVIFNVRKETFKVMCVVTFIKGTISLLKHHAQE